MDSTTGREREIRALPCALPHAFSALALPERSRLLRHALNAAPRPLLAPPRQSQSCWVDDVTGDVVFQFKATELVRITTRGDIALDSGGKFDVSAGGGAAGGHRTWGRG